MLKDSSKTKQALRRILSTVFKTALMEVMEAMGAFVKHAMKIVKPALDRVAITAILVPKERSKTAQVR